MSVVISLNPGCQPDTMIQTREKSARIQNQRLFGQESTLRLIFSQVWYLVTTDQSIISVIAHDSKRLQSIIGEVTSNPGRTLFWVFKVLKLLKMLKLCLISLSIRGVAMGVALPQMHHLKILYEKISIYNVLVIS